MIHPYLLYLHNSGQPTFLKRTNYVLATCGPLFSIDVKCRQLLSYFLTPRENCQVFHIESVGRLGISVAYTWFRKQIPSKDRVTQWRLTWEDGRTLNFYPRIFMRLLAERRTKKVFLSGCNNDNFQNKKQFHWSKPTQMYLSWPEWTAWISWQVKSELLAHVLIKERLIFISKSSYWVS